MIRTDIPYIHEHLYTTTSLNSPTHHGFGSFFRKVKRTVKSAVKSVSSGGLAGIIGVAAAIAIPFVAPAIAGAIAGSFGVSFASIAAQTLGSAVVGAGLGGLTSAATGGDWRQGALMGGIGGGLGGFTQAGGFNGISGGTEGATISAGTDAAAAPVTTDIAGLGGAAPAPGVPSYTTAAYGPAAPGLRAPAAAGQTFVGAPTAAAPGGIELQLGGQYAAGVVAPNAPAVTSFNVAGVPSGAGLSYGATAPNFTETLQAGWDKLTNPQTYAKATEGIMERVTDPQNIAETGTQLVGQYLSNTLAPLPDMPPELAEEFDKQRAELEVLKGKDEEAYQLKLQEAKNLISQSRHFNPEYFGGQAVAASRAQTSRAKQAGLRRMGGGYGDAARMAEARRFDLEGSRQAGSAYDRGWQAGLGARTSTHQAGINAIPKADSRYLTALSQFGGNVWEDYYKRREQQQKERENVMGIWSGLTGAGAGANT